MNQQGGYRRLRALTASLPGAAPRRYLTRYEESLARVIAERRGLPLEVVRETVLQAVNNPPQESLLDIAERIAHRRQVSVAEVYRQAAEVVQLADD